MCAASPSSAGQWQSAGARCRKTGATGLVRWPSVLDAVFLHFAAGEGKQRWCEKTPQHAQHIVALAMRFPAARFIHVIRDGRDCAVSFHRRWKRQPELTVFRWKKMVSVGREQGRRLGAGRYLEVRYEDLTAEPEFALRRICVFLGLPFDRGIARIDAALPASRCARRTRSSAKLRQVAHLFFPADSRTARSHSRPDARICGYDTQSPESDANIAGMAPQVLVGYGNDARSTRARSFAS